MSSVSLHCKVFLVCSSFNPILKPTRISPWRSHERQTEQASSSEGRVGSARHSPRVSSCTHSLQSYLFSIVVRTKSVSDQSNIDNLLTAQYSIIFPIYWNFGSVSNVSYGECHHHLFFFFLRAILFCVILCEI